MKPHNELEQAWQEFIDYLNSPLGDDIDVQNILGRFRPLMDRIHGLMQNGDYDRSVTSLDFHRFMEGGVEMLSPNMKARMNSYALAQIYEAEGHLPEDSRPAA